MTARAEMVTGVLKAAKGQYICQACLMEASGVHPAAQINQIVRPLERSRDYRYSKAPCGRCGNDRSCIA